MLLITGCALSEIDIPPWEPGDNERMEEASIYTNIFNERYAFYRDNFVPGFHFIASRFSYDVPFFFDDLDGDLIGICRHKDGVRYILYDRDSWDEAPDVRKKAAVFHENGHCILDRDHKCNPFDNTGLLSLMYPKVHGEFYLNMPLTDPPSNYWEESTINYLELELFDGFYQGKDDNCPNFTGMVDDVEIISVLDKY